MSTFLIAAIGDTVTTRVDGVRSIGNCTRDRPNGQTRSAPKAARLT